MLASLNCNRLPNVFLLATGIMLSSLWLLSNPADAQVIAKPIPIPSYTAMVSLSPVLNIAVFGLLGVTLLNLIASLAARNAPRLRLYFSWVSVSFLIGYVCFVLLGAPLSRYELVMSLCILFGLIAQVRFTTLFRLGDVRSSIPTEEERRSLSHPAHGSLLDVLGKQFSGEEARMQLVMVGLASLTMALGAANMFALQPMIGKLLAPWLGSVPAVWTTCMLFFQMILLAGYVYVHWLTKSFGIKRQLLFHGVAVAIAITSLPLALPELMIRNIPEEGYHVFWIFITLTITVGGPAFVLSATAPLIQAWFGATTHKLASNPYPLYVASNSGSLIGLISYPFLVEPNLSLTTQRAVWSVSWLIYAVLLSIVAILCWRRMKSTSPSASEAVAALSQSASKEKTVARSFGLAAKLTWVALSFVTSSLLLGATSHMSMDIAAMPMLWTIPLAIYLLSWTLGFADYAPWLHRAIGLIAPFAVIAASFTWAANFHEQIRWLLAVHMLALLAVCWTLHRRLYESRPEATELTSFYIAIALGGALGGTFNALIAPLIFSGFIEYPLALVAALLFLPGADLFAAPKAFGARFPTVWQRIIFLTLIIGCTAVLSLYAHQSIRWSTWNLQPISTRLGWTDEQVGKWLEFSMPLLPAVLLLGRPRTQALVISTALLVGVCVNLSSNILLRDRTFFGVLTVRTFNRYDRVIHTLEHGGILHGEQWRKDQPDQREARTYYHKNGPLGDIMDIMAQRKDSFSTAAIGLGTGSIAAYGQANRPITFFEIDSAVESIARNPAYFTYVSDCLERGGPLEVKLGDARVTMAKTNDIFDVMIIDAFSSDSIPLHLITLEAIEGWFHRLRSDGVIAFHVSNRYIDLAPVLANAADKLGVSAFLCEDHPGDPALGHSSSTWVVLTADPGTEDWFISRPRWTKPTTRPGLTVWTDDFASVLPVMRF